MNKRNRMRIKILCKVSSTRGRDLEYIGVRAVWYLYIFKLKAKN